MDDVLFVLLENTDKASSHVAVCDLAQGTWSACPDIPLNITSASMAAHDGKLLVAGIHRDEDGDHSRMFSLDPASGRWTQFDASNLPLASALVDCEGDLLVVGQLLGGIDSFRQPTRIARWELREAGTSTPYEVTEEDIVCTLAGTYTPTKKVGTHDLASYPPLVAVQGNCLYVADSYRTDADGEGMGVALEKVARAANGTYSSSDYTNIVRRNDDEGSTDEGIRLDKSVFALAAASFGPVVVGARAYVGGERLDSDTLVLRDETVGLGDLGRHYSASALEGVVACVHKGKLYVAAIPTDESVNYHLRVQPLECLVRFVNDDGTELQSGYVAYGDTPAYAGTTPRKKETQRYTFEFSGWTPDIAPVTGDITYVATYASKAKSDDGKAAPGSSIVWPKGLSDPLGVISRRVAGYMVPNGHVVPRGYVGGVKSDGWNVGRQSTVSAPSTTSASSPMQAAPSYEVPPATSTLPAAPEVPPTTQASPTPAATLGSAGIAGATSEPVTVAQVTLPNTGDESDVTVTALAYAGTCTLCLAALIAYRRRCRALTRVEKRVRW